MCLGLVSFLGNIITGAGVPDPVARTKSRHLGSNTKSNTGGISSNLYANGANQNVGNVITGRPMIRVNAPPGGNSSFSISTMFSG